MYPPFNTNLYRTVGNTIQTLVFKRVEGNFIVLENENRVTIKVPVSQYGTLCLSKRMLLAELEESLKKQLADVHLQMREMAIAYNPVDPFNVYRIPAGNSSAKEVHKYDSKTGKYIESYPSVSFAEQAHGKTAKSTNITFVCTGRMPSAYGFRWSYEKFDYLK